MTEQRIMYVCSECADNFPEACGHFDRNDLRVLPDGKWLCEGCFEDTTQADRGNTDEDEYKDWSDLPSPRVYAAVEELTPRQIMEQHLGWIILYAEMMTIDNWRDMKLRIDRQAKEAKKCLLPTGIIEG